MSLPLDRLEVLYPSSLISEFHRVFGGEDTLKFLTIFAGTTIRVPSSKDQEKMSRGIEIYDALSTKTVSRRHLRERFGLSGKALRAIFREMKRSHRLATQHSRSDALVGKHIVKARRGARRKRRTRR